MRRIAGATELPLLVDADTGWGAAFNIARTTSELSRAGAGGMHLEDQVQAKRCGHRPGKALVGADEMADRIKAAVDGRSDDSFVLMARTDAHAVEGQAAAIERAQRYVAAGADMIFAEALATLDEYRQFTTAVQVPVLANITEFGKTPLFTVTGARVGRRRSRALSAVGVPRDEPRRGKGLRHDPLRRARRRRRSMRMQTRAELYEVLGYHEYERKLDDLFGRQAAVMSEERTPGFKPKKSVALSGVVAGNTALCTVGRTGNDLHYRGYDILDVAAQLRVRRDRAPADPRQAAEPRGARRVQGEAGEAARLAGRSARRARAAAGRQPSDGRHALRACRRSAACCPRRTITAPPARATSPTG